jgi:hypothetical protein
MWCSAYPWVVLIGVSPGNSPRKQDRNHNFTVETADGPTFGEPHVGFDYPDTKQYWAKCKDLATFLVQRDAPTMNAQDAVALASHLNLGTRQAGRANAELMEPNVQHWVRHLLMACWSPKIILCFGLMGFLRRSKYGEVWKSSPGLQVDWTAPDCEAKFSDFNYKFRLWTVQTANPKPTALVAWPNHPSRHPFGGGHKSKPWLQAKEQVHGILEKHGF